MCGICFCLNGLPISQIFCQFDFFELYRDNPGNNFTLTSKTENYLKYIQDQKLFISNFNPQDIQNTIINRGPDAFRCYKLTLPNTSTNLSADTKIHEIKPEDKLYTQNIFSEPKITQNEQNQNQNEESKGEIEYQSNIEIIAACSVLHMRGEYEKPNPQPLIHEKTKNVLLYNGEIFNVESSRLEQLKNKYQSTNKEHIVKLIEKFDPFSNDTHQILQILNSFSEVYFSKEKENTMNYAEEIMGLINCFNADFAFVYIDLLNSKITFSKDIFGKRSLLLGLHQNGFCISSCSIKPNASQNQLEQDDNGEEEGGNATAQGQPDDKERKHNGLIKQEFLKEFLEKKYNNEYFSALKKNWLEIPANKLYNGSLQLANVQIGIKEPKIEFEFLRLMYWNLRKYKEKENFQPLEENEEKKEFKYEDQFVKEGLVVDEKVAIEKVAHLFKTSILNLLQNIITLKSYFHDHKESNKIGQSEEFKSDEVNITKSEVAILFSGGLDSTLIALYASQVLPYTASQVMGVGYEWC